MGVRSGKVWTRKSVAESTAHVTEATTHVAKTTTHVTEPAAHVTAAESAAVSSTASPARKRIRAQSAGESSSRSQNDHGLSQHRRYSFLHADHVHLADADFINNLTCT
jgi:uncharacterized protein (DUF885 family)